MPTSILNRPAQPATGRTPRTGSTQPADRPVRAARASRRGPACATAPEVFQDPLVEDPPRGSLTREDRARQARLVGQARSICESCPLRTACLYDAVVRHDVAGFVVGTTVRQRGEIRRRLGVVVEPEDLDTLAGVVGGARQVDHDEVLRLRRANPDETLEQLAHRLGCSLSTVKRHLRRERQAPTVTRTTTRPLPVHVLRVTAQVVAGPAALRKAA